MSEVLVKSYSLFGTELILGEMDGSLCLCDYKYRKARESVDKRIQAALSARYVESDSVFLDQAYQQLCSYSVGERTRFDIPISLCGTHFQQSVWRALLDIPYGETRTYSALADILGDRKAVRAVAAANGANALSIIVPCHRIVGSRGELTGYAGGLPLKRRLLEIEQGTMSLDLFGGSV